MSIRKYVGATARSMGSDPAYVAHRDDGKSAVFADRANALAFERRHPCNRER